MKFRVFRRSEPAIDLVTAIILGWLLLLPGFAAAQASVSRGTLPLHEVMTIYVTPTPDNFTRALQSRLEAWGALTITSQVEQADAILSCHKETRIVPAKLVLRLTEAEVNLIDRQSGRLIWNVKRSATWGLESFGRAPSCGSLYLPVRSTRTTVVCTRAFAGVGFYACTRRNEREACTSCSTC